MFLPVAMAIAVSLLLEHNSRITVSNTTVLKQLHSSSSMLSDSIPFYCFFAVLASPGSGSSGSNGTVVNGTALPTCDPSTQPALAPNYAQLQVTIAPGQTKDVDSYLCTRGTSGVGTSYSITLGKFMFCTHCRCQLL